MSGRVPSPRVRHGGNAADFNIKNEIVGEPATSIAKLIKGTPDLIPRPILTLL